MSGGRQEHFATTSPQRETSANIQSDIIALLSNPRTYGEKGGVCVHRTHGSIVFLCGSFAYKLKRAVKFPYMDYSMPELRKAMCFRELEVNRRTAPELYCGVKGIIPRGAELALGDPEDPNAKDWVVVMKRFAQSDLLEQRRKDGRLSREDMLTLGDVIAGFHQSAEVTPEYGGADAIRAVIAENVSMLRDAPANIASELVSRYSDLSNTVLQRLGPILEGRRRQDKIRRCHGDLHLNNVCLIGGKPVLFDAIEFNDAFSCIDVGYDLAFTLMDLDAHDLRADANTLLNRYLERSKDYGMLQCLPLFLSCRAAIRAHVAIAAALAGAGGAREKEALTLLQDAIGYLMPPQPKVIAIGGLSGTGKTTIARALAPRIGAAPGAVVLRSDVQRKEMFQISETQKLPECGYAPGVSAQVYASLCDLAVSIARAGHSAIVDATFISGAERSSVAEAAKCAGVPFQGIWLDAPRRTLERRLVSRKGDASDADVAVLGQQIQAVSPPQDWKRIDADAPAAEVIARIQAAI